MFCGVFLDIGVTRRLLIASSEVALERIELLREFNDVRSLFGCETLDALSVRDSRIRSNFLFLLSTAYAIVP